MSIVRFGRFPRALLFCLSVGAGLLAAVGAGAAPGGRSTIDVLVPEAGNLQLVAFWVALGGGYFTREGLDVNVVTPESPNQAEAAFKTGTPPVALLPGPAYERLIAARFPFLLAANLLQNDPLILILNHDIAKRVKMSDGMPLRQRLDFLRSATIGVASADRVRLYSLFRSQGMDANIARIDIVKGEEQIGQFAGGSIEAIFAKTPNAERALVENDGAIVMSGPLGELPAFSDRLVQALAVTRSFADARPGDVRALVRAIAKAEHALRFEPKVATAAVLQALPKSDKKQVARLIALYEHAIPATPHIEPSFIEREAKLYPVGGDPLDLSGINLNDVIFSGETFAVEPLPARAGRETGRHESKGHSRKAFAVVLVGLLALGIALFFVFKDQRDGLDVSA